MLYYYTKVDIHTLYKNCCNRRGTGAFNKSKLNNPTGVQMKDGSAKYSLRDTEKRIRRQRNQLQGVLRKINAT